MSAVLARVHRPVPNLIPCHAAAVPHVGLSSPDVEQSPRDEQKHPQEQIDDPPPGADEQPPEAAMAFLPVLGAGSGHRAPVLLEGLTDYVVSMTFRTGHTDPPICNTLDIST